MGSWDRLRPGGDVLLAAVGKLIDLWTGGDDGLLWFIMVYYGLLWFIVVYCGL